jgi:hypothetical protein
MILVRTDYPYLMVGCHIISGRRQYSHSLSGTIRRNSLESPKFSVFSCIRTRRIELELPKPSRLAINAAKAKLEEACSLGCLAESQLRRVKFSLRRFLRLVVWRPNEVLFNPPKSMVHGTTCTYLLRLFPSGMASGCELASCSRADVDRRRRMATTARRRMRMTATTMIFVRDVSSGFGSSTGFRPDGCGFEFIFALMG